MFTKVNFLGTFDTQKGLKNGQKWKYCKMTQKFVIPTQKIPRNEYKHYYVIFGPIWPPKRAKNGHAQNAPLMGHTHKNKLLSRFIHHFELPCKKSAQTDKRFLRYSIFKNRAIWLAKSFLAIFVVKKKLKKAISQKRMTPEKSFCTLSLLEMATFDDFLGLFWDCDCTIGPKKGKTKKSYRLVFQKIVKKW